MPCYVGFAPFFLAVFLGSFQMDLSAFSQLDDSTVSVLAMLLGIIGGWYFTGLHQQLKAKRVKMSGKKHPTFRKE
jgi:hypothetical protein